MTVQVNVDVRDEVGPDLAALIGRASSLGPMLDDIGAANVASTQQRFLDEESPEGDAWARHSAVTAARRGAGAEILRNRNDLFDTISHHVEGDEVRVGQNRVYARIQHLGGFAGRGLSVEIPARPSLGVSDDDREEFEAIVSDHLRGAR